MTDSNKRIKIEDVDSKDPGAGIPSVVTSSEVLNQLVPDAVEKVRT